MRAPLRSSWGWVMALFGAPIAHEDAPQRALYAALGFNSASVDMLTVAAGRIEFSMRIGLNTGLVVVAGSVMI